MSRQVGSLHRSISYPANLQRNLPIIPLFTFPPPESAHDNTSSSMESVTNSNTTVYNTISQFSNSDIETPDKFANSEPSPSTFSQPPFQPIHSQVKIEPLSLPLPFHQKYFIESIPFEDVNLDQLRHSNFKFRKIHIENKLTRFQIYPETELACKYTKPLYKTQFSETFVEYEQGFDMNTRKLILHPMATFHLTSDENSYIPKKFPKNTGNIGGKLKPLDKDSTRLLELSLMKNTPFGAIHYDIHLGMKLDYTISRNFQERSLTELETLHQLCELKRTQILQ